MTYIEYFDRALIENICASITNPPDRVILVGDKLKTLTAHAERYAGILRERGVEVEFIARSVNRGDMAGVVEVLSSIVETYDDCVFDVTGGDEAFLVATGIVFERYRDRNIQMHRFNIQNNTVQDCDLDGRTILESELPVLTLEENIRIYGGEIVYDDLIPYTTHLWDLDGDLLDDVDTMWDICRQDVRLWNTQLGVFMLAEQFRDPADDTLTTTAPKDYLVGALESIGAKYIFSRRLINRLYHAGLIDAHDYEDVFTITYKDEQVKRCLTKAGEILELKIFSAALNAVEKDGSYTYNDVLSGVFIDWDGEIHLEPGSHDTENEVDVMMMRGFLPVFVSCKNGCVDINELYKLSTVAERFGGKYARKVLVATALGNTDASEYVRQRARDMGIKLVEGVQSMDEDELVRSVRSFWRPETA